MIHKGFSSVTLDTIIFKIFITGKYLYMAMLNLIKFVLQRYFFDLKKVKAVS